jgi:DNA repair exonuclease SbcCD ATPase subunit
MSAKESKDIDKERINLLAKKKVVEDRLDIRRAQYKELEKELKAILNSMDPNLKELEELNKAIRLICLHKKPLAKFYHASGQDDDNSYSWFCQECGQEFEGGGAIPNG